MRTILIRMNALPPELFSPAQIEVRPTGDNSASTREVSIETLLAGSRELVIKHAGRDYHLRLTKQGKLILTA